MKPPLRLLLIEDSEDDAALLLATLQSGGYEPTCQRVETAEALRQALHVKEWDLVISDYSLPAFDGPTAIRILRELACDLPIIVVSGAIGEDLAVETLKMGADDYLLKENLARLVPAVERSLQMAEIGRRHRNLEHMKTLIMANSLDLICSLDAQDRFLEASKVANSVFGCPSLELAERFIIDFIHPEDQERTRSMLEEVRKGHPSRNFENRCLHQSGRLVCMMWSAVWSPTDSVMILVGRDVTELNNRVSTLHLRESALAHVSQGVLISDENRQITYANPSFTKITGYAANDILSRSCSILQGPETDPATIDKIREALNAGRHFEGEILNYRKNGESFWNELSLAPITDGSRHPVRFIGILRDVTERRQMEAALHQETAFFEAQVESSLDGILVVNVEGKKILQNQRMIELWKLPASLAQSEDNDELLNFFVGQTINPEQSAARFDHLMSHPDEIRRGEVKLIDGTILDRYSAPVRDHAGRYYGRIWSFRDITTDRIREEKLARALELEKELTGKALAGDRAKSEFLAVMSHEVRTPLNAILGFAEILADTPDLPKVSRDHAQTIKQSGEALLQILDDILDFSRLEANRLTIESVAFSPRKLLTEIDTLFGPSATNKNLDFSTSISETVPEWLLGDVGRLRQILLNLVGNAIKFTESGRVRLEMTELPDQPSFFTFSVRDTGPGIPPDQLNQIFLPFTQADSSISRRHGGTGLGLSISRRLTELMGGSLTGTSEPGKYSEFLVTVPLEVSPSKNVALTSPPPKSWNKEFASHYPLQVLIVEDDVVNLKLMGVLIRRLGYDPLMAKTGKEALEVIACQKINCVLMDLHMPEMDGIEATKKIRSHEKNEATKPTFICALTANIFPTDQQRCFEAGMNAYLNKPIKIASLVNKLREAHDYVQVNAS